jgi:hypothetical protein
MPIFEIERIIGRGFASAEDAVAPFLGARSGLPHIKGHFKLPESELTYRGGPGRSLVELPLRLSVRSELTGYTIAIRICRISPVHQVFVLCGGIFFGSLAFADYWSGRRSGIGAMLGIAVATCLASLLLGLFDFMAAHEAIGEISKAYQQRGTNQTKDPAPQARINPT